MEGWYGREKRRKNAAKLLKRANMLKEGTKSNTKEERKGVERHEFKRRRSLMKGSKSKVFAERKR